VVELGAEPDLARAVERELTGDPGAWWSGAGSGEQAVTALGARVRDRRGEGPAGVVGDLLTSGEPVLLVVADVERRRAGLEQTLAAMAPDGLRVVSWEALGADPGLGSDFAHVVALDPPPVAEAGGVLELAAATGRPGIAQLAWGEPERAFALACWRERLDLRPALVELWRTLDAAGELTGAALESALRGTGAHPRNGAHCGRLVRVLCELGLAEWKVDIGRYSPDRRSGRVPPAVASLVAGRGERTDLARSPAYRAYTARLALAERQLATTPPAETRATG
jgi:single-stranded-DNA-specific exonuclease